MRRVKECISGAPTDESGVCTEHGETACVIEVPRMNRWNPLYWADRAASTAVRRRQRLEKTLVREGGSAARRLWLYGCAKFAVVMALLLVAIFSDRWRDAAMPWIGMILGGSALSTLVRAQSYRAGWLDGRRAILGSMARFGSPGEWVQHEMEYDAYHVMDLAGPEVPDSPEHLDG